MFITTAAVARAGAGEFGVEALAIEDPRPDELLVRFTAAGLCHTDLEVAAGRLPTPLPVVAGHEGTGIIEGIGRDVTGFAVGDRVVAGFNFCGGCALCMVGQPAYCPEHTALNFGARRSDGTVGLRDGRGEPVHDHFFGQSSFAGHGLCRPSGLVTIDDDSLPDDILAPLGCSISTGAGAVWNTIGVTPASSVLVVGAGAVGLSAVLAAVVAGASRIIVADTHKSRLELAGKLGATDVIDVAKSSTVEEVMAFTRGRGVDFSVESAGSSSAMTSAIESLAPLGRAAVLGVVPVGDLRANAFELLQGRSVMGSIIGHQASSVLIPRIVDLYRRGRFPIDTLIRSYPLTAINDAVADVAAGATVKAVFKHAHGAQR